MKIVKYEYDSFLKLHEKLGINKTKKVYEIPYYQRPYEWDEEHISNLIEDFDKNKKLNEKDTGLEYFAGAVVFISTKDEKLEVVDGQQRITTMFLINCIRFILMRAQLDADVRNIKNIGRALMGGKELLNLIKQVFTTDDWSVMEHKINELYESIVKVISATGESYLEYADEIIQMTENTIHTVSKSQQDETFIEANQRSNYELYEEYDLALKYSMDVYDKKLKMALSKIVCIVDEKSEEPHLFLKEKDIDQIKKEDEIIGQYVEAMYIIYQTCDGIVKMQGLAGRAYTDKLIETMKEMVENIKLCAVCAENERDAYILFESLNDRSKEVEDLELIKNLYLRAYYNKSNDEGRMRQKGLDQIAKEWDNHIFTKANRIELSLFGTVYLTGASELDGKNGYGVRKAVDSYLEQKESYSLEQVLNDIKIYKMVRIILDRSLDGNKLNDNVLKKENTVNCSVVCKTISLLRAMKCSNVLSGVINVVLHFYLKEHTGTIDVDDFEKNYINKLYFENDWQEDKYGKIYTMAHNMWRLALLSKDYKLPRKYSIQMIDKYHKYSECDSICDVSSLDLVEAKKEFDSWVTTWRYSRSNRYNIRLKVLFFRLIQTNNNKEQNKLIIGNATRITFKNPEDAQLDHLEPENPEDKSGHGYFGMNDIRNREDIVNGIGNFMLLDDYNNIKKSNGRFENAMEYYDSMFNNVSHWMIEDIKAALLDPELVIEEEGHKIPTEKFFQQRREKLCRYFKAILSAERYDAKEIEY